MNIVVVALLFGAVVTYFDAITENDSEKNANRSSVFSSLSVDVPERRESGVGCEQSPDIQSTPPTSAKVGESYLYRPKANDDQPDSISWRLSPNPYGCLIDDNQTVRWTPSLEGVYEFEIVAIDACGNPSPPQQWSVSVD